MKFVKVKNTKQLQLLCSLKFHNRFLLELTLFLKIFLWLFNCRKGILEGPTWDSGSRIRFSICPYWPIWCAPPFRLRDRHGARLRRGRDHEEKRADRPSMRGLKCWLSMVFISYYRIVIGKVGISNLTEYYCDRTIFEEINDYGGLFQEYNLSDKILKKCAH